MEKIVQIRKKEGLQSIKTQNGNLNPSIFHQEHKDDKAGGTPTGTYRSSGLPSTKQFISPMWNRLKHQWSWGGTPEDLEKLILKLKLTYADNHPKAGHFIEPEDVNYRLRNSGDEVFNHITFYGSRFMEQGKATLRQEDPVEEFLYYCMVADPRTDDKRDTTSKYIRMDTKFEIISPKEDHKMAADEVDVQLESAQLLIGMMNNEDKMRSVCSIMALPGYDERTSEASSMKILLTEASRDLSVVGRYDNKRIIDKFIEVASMKDQDLFLLTTIMRGKKFSFLQKRNNHFLFQGEKLEGLKSDTDLINYFDAPANVEHFQALLKALETVDYKSK